MLFVDDADESLEYSGVDGTQVAVLVDVCAQVVESGLAALDHHLPVAPPHCYLVGLTELPVEMVVDGLLCGAAFQSGQEGQAVEPVLAATGIAAGKVVHADGLAERGQHIPEGHLVLTHAARSHMPRPTHDEGDAYATLVTTALQAFQFAVAAEERGVGTALLMGAVVACEDHHSALGQPLAVQFAHQLTHVAVQSRYHGSKLGMRVHGGVISAALVTRIVFVLLELPHVVLYQAVVGLHELGMGQGVSKQGEEWLAFLLPVEPLHGAAVNEVGAVLRAPAVVLAAHCVAYVLLQHLAHHGRVAPRAAEPVEEVGVVEVGLELADVAEELIYAALVGRAHRAFVAAGPLAELCCGVSSVLHDLGQHHVGRVERMLSGDGIFMVLAIHDIAAPVLAVASDGTVTRVLACHQRCSAGCADGAAGISLREEHALRGQSVDVGSLYVRLAVARQVAISHVVAQDKQDVGFLPLVLCSGGCSALAVCRHASSDGHQCQWHQRHGGQCEGRMPAPLVV